MLFFSHAAPPLNNFHKRTAISCIDSRLDRQEKRMYTIIVKCYLARTSGP